MPLTVSVMRNGCFWSLRVDGALRVSGPGSPAGVCVKTNPPSKTTHNRQAMALAQVMAGASRGKREVASRSAIVTRQWQRSDEKASLPRQRGEDRRQGKCNGEFRAEVLTMANTNRRERSH